ILFIVFALGLCIAQAQDFKETTKYIAKSEIGTKQKEYQPKKIQIITVDETSENVASVAISNSYQYDAIRISVLDSPQLRGIKEVLKVELEYNSYSIEIDTYYFLVTTKGAYIALPKVTKVYDDILQPIEDYIFPTQTYGQEETILRAEFNYTNEVKKVLQRFVWNDDDFDSEEAVTAIR
ncbi:MAG: hypothetical protein AB8B59_11510, partial [Maribacter sp.]